MHILRPDGRLRLDEQLVNALSNGDGVERRYLVVLCGGDVDPERLEPFATLAQVLRDTVDRELRVVVTDGWPERFWTTEVAGALDATDLDGTFELSPTLDQRRRALEQRVADGRLEVLFVERGRVRGSALTGVAPQRDDGRPLPLNAKLAMMDLLQAARDALVWRPRPLQDLVRDAREALGLPAGSVTSIAAVRRARGEVVAGEEGAISVDRVGEALREAMARPGPGVSVVTVPAVAAPAPVRQGGSSMARPAGSPAVRPGAPGAGPTPKRPPAEDRHALEQGKCLRCGKSGQRLDEPCGRTDLGRVGLLELD